MQNNISAAGEGSKAKRKGTSRRYSPVLKNDYEFRRAYNKGKSAASGSVVVYAFKKKRGGIRIGITTGKKIGNAVKRNRARRLIREAYRLMKAELSGNWDIVFVARTRTAELKMQDVQKDMARLMKKLGVKAEEQAE